MDTKIASTSNQNPLSTFLESISSKIAKFASTVVEKARNLKNKFVSFVSELRGPDGLKRVKAKIKNALTFENLTGTITRIKDSLNISKITGQISSFLDNAN